MRLLLLMLLTACGPKEPPQPAAPEPAAAPAPAPEPEPEPEPAAPAAKANNADFSATLTFANGTSKSGRVVRVERSIDWYGEEGWTMDAAELQISGDGGDAFKKLNWTDVRSVTVKPGAVPADVDCFYDSNWTPWMYDCTLKTTGTVTDAAGKKWTVDNRHKWKFTFDDGSEVEFWLYKYSARQQDSVEVDLNTENPENTQLYVQLQQQLREALKGQLVTAIKVQ